tara:strand:- start:1884 stop:3014 length:1131 start_codon:yes stop_codon:yes gene_type:complete
MNYLIITILTFFFTFSSSIFAANFNYGTEFAAKSELAHLSLINALEKVGGRIYGVGVHGIIIFSDDEGETWVQADSVPTQNTLTGISCSTEQLCWATGHDATILHSGDFGKTWEIQYIDVDFDAPLLSIHMYDDSNGIAIGAFALSLRTSNGGVSWDYLFVTDDEFQPHLNYTYGDGQAWRQSSIDEGYAVGEMGKYYVSDDQGLNWLEIDTGYFGSFWSGIKVDNGQSLLLGMSGKVTLATLIDRDENPPEDKEVYVACYESGSYVDECKVYVFDNLFIGTKNSLTDAIVLDDGRIAMSGNGGAISIVDLHRNRDIQTCVRADRLSNTSIIQLNSDEFLLAGEKGVRKHSMRQCLDNFNNQESNSQDSYITVSID